MTLADVVLAKQWELDALRQGFRPDALDSLDQAHRLDITFTSNAIDGNTLTLGETAAIVENGATVVGKPLKDHLEVVEHAKALEWICGTEARSGPSLSERDIKHLHRLLTAQSNPAVAGRYADRPRMVAWDAGTIEFPGPADIPALMAKYCSWLAAAPNDPASAFEAHVGVLSIHPFNDGNGRTARLLMNLILARAGYPAIAVRPDDRPAYLQALATAQAGKGDRDFKALLFGRLDQTLDIYLSAARQAQSAAGPAAQKRT
jgi:Fic family protein